MFGSFTPSLQQSAALTRVEAEVRERFRLAPGTAVLVTELVCALPGCPPLETVIAFWSGDEGDTRRYHYKVFKPVQQVTADDLPPWWMKEALVAAPDWACGCC